MSKNIVDARALKHHRLYLRFEDGVEGEVDLAGMIEFTGLLAPLADPTYFAQVTANPNSGTVSWPNGADLDRDVLYTAVRGVAAEGHAAQADTSDLYPRSSHRSSNGKLHNATAGPKKLLERSLVWFVIGVIFTSIVGTLAALNWLDNFIIKRIPSVDEIMGQLENDSNATTRLRQIVGFDEAIWRGSVVAFDRGDGCPGPGWDRFTAANGRVIVGANEGGSLEVRQFGTDGGEETARLEPDHIPNHRHEFWDTYFSVDDHLLTDAGVSQKITVPDELGSGNADRNNVGGQIRSRTEYLRPNQNSDSNEPFEIMPPFYVLIYCKKL